MPRLQQCLREPPPPCTGQTSGRILSTTEQLADSVQGSLPATRPCRPSFLRIRRIPSSPSVQISSLSSPGTTLFLLIVTPTGSTSSNCPVTQLKTSSCSYEITFQPLGSQQHSPQMERKCLHPNYLRISAHGGELSTESPQLTIPGLTRELSWLSSMLRD